MNQRTIADQVASLTPAQQALLEQRLKKKGLESLVGKPIVPRPRSGWPPLSFAQRRLWFLDQYEPGSSVYNVPSATRLRGRLNVSALAQSLKEIVNRHESLRTTFVVVEGEPAQVIASSVEHELSVVDLGTFPDGEKEEQAQRICEEQARRPFDLSRGPLFRSDLIRLGEDDHILLLTMHHIVSDGWSMGVLNRELAVLYRAFFRSLPSPLSPLAIQYADYAVWQREVLEGQVLADQLNYWKRQLAGVPEVLNLPTDRPRPPVQSFRGARQTLELSSELTEALKELSRKEGVTLFMTLLAAFQILLYRYSGQEDIIVGSPIANRNRAEIEGLIGFFVNTLVLRTTFGDGPTFRELLSRVKETALQAYAHQDLPFEKLVEELKPGRSLRHSPLFQVLFVLQNAPVRLRELENLTLSLMQLTNDTTKFDLSLALSERSNGLHGSLEYNTDLFDGSTIRRMTGHFQMLLEGIVAGADRPVCDLPILTEAEKSQVLVEWNDTKRDYPHDQCLHELFEEQAEKRPDAIAVALEEEQLTYRELNQRANRLAHYLRKHGVAIETLVGICVERSLDMIVGLLGILKAGAAYVPLDPSYPKERLAFMLEDTGAPVLLTQRRLIEALPVFDGKIVCLDGDDAQEISAEKASNLDDRVTAENLAYVIYTSGSTGNPKGVQVLHKGVLRLLLGVDYVQLDANETFLQLASPSFDASTFEIWGALLHGARCVLFPGKFFSPSELGVILHRHKVSTLWLTASLFNAVIDEAPESLSGVRQLLIGGEALSIFHVRRALACLPETRIINGYGPTESTTFACCCSIPALLDEHVANVPIGRPIANTEIYLLDSHLSPVPIGIPGELYIGGEGLARSYLSQPELTAENFVPHPFDRGAGARLYRTGDLCRYLPDGNIEFLGRIDHQVKIRGFRVELGEIETVLGRHPSVREAVVIAHEDDSGDASALRSRGKRLVAYVVLDKEQTCAISDLRGFLKQQLPEFMVPSAFVDLDALPVTTSGKVDRKALAVSGYSRSEPAQDFVAPRTPIEELLAAIWAEVLELERIGVHDNFFDLGGHSLLATSVNSRIRDALQLNMPLRMQFESPTIAELAERIEALRREAQGLVHAPIVATPREGKLPLSFAQERLWFLDQYEPNSALYNIPSALRLRGCLNIEALEQSLNEIIRRHESLRTTFSAVEGEPVQLIGPSVGRSLVVVDLRGHPEGEREEEVRRLVHEEARRPFDLAQGPLFRSKLLRLGEDDHVLLLTMHHIVSDGWSMGVLNREFAVLYRSFVRGESSPLVALPIQYADFAVWQRKWLQGEILDRQLAYWKKQLEGIPGILKLPTDRTRPAVQTYQGAGTSIELSRELSEGLKELSRKQGGTLFMTLLAAFQTLLYRYTGQEDIVVGSPIANRNRAEIEGLIGFFVNTLVLRSNFSGNPTFKELLARVKETALGAYAHQDLPFEKLVEELKPERTLSYSPLVQVMFVLQNASATAREFEGLSVSPIRIGGETSKFDLSLSMVESGETITGRIQYNTDLFDNATMQRMSGHFQTLLREIVADPQRAVSDLAMLDEAETHRLLVEWNDSQRDYPKGKCIQQLFEEQVERSPDTVAVVFEGEQLTYKELNQRANQVAHYLQKRGVTAETMVGICVERSLEMIIGLLGILKAGGAYVPLDPQYPEDRLNFMIEDTETAIILTHRRVKQRLGRHRDRSICLDDEWVKLAQQSTDNPIADVTPQALAYVIYTSGTTGMPKGVMIEHRSVVNYLSWFNQSGLADKAQRMPLVTKPTFDACLKQLFAPLSRGDQVWIVSEQFISSPAGLLKSFEASGVTALNCVPSFWTALLDVIESNPTFVSDEVFSSLFLGGEPFSDTLIERTHTRFPHLEIWNLYGPTEATANAVAGRITGEGRITLGRPVGSAEVYLLDAHFQPVPIGVAGELYIGGVGLARGYLKRAEQTSESFIPHPFSNQPGARLYKTGDICRYLPDGSIEFLGRVDQQVKVRGFRIELGEIESVLGEHPAVRDVVVVAREEDSAGSTKRLVAYVVASQGSVPTIDELRGYLKGKLPEYMLPSAFVYLSALPLTANGKIDRKALPAFDSSSGEQHSQQVAPRDELELQLTRLWERVLKVRAIGIRDNFFDLGGHSLLAVRLFAQMEKIIGKELPLATLFSAPTIEQLAGLIRQQQWSTPWKSLVAIQPSGSLPPLFCVHAHDGGVLFWRDLARCLGPDQPFYALQPRGLDGLEPLHTTVEEMASHYVQEIRTLQPEGPYYVSGHCIGGLIAFEMAQQLHAQGETVAFLGVIDSFAPVRQGSKRSSVFRRYCHRAIRFFERTVTLHFGNLSVLKPSERLSYVQGKIDKALYKVYMGLGSRWVAAARNRQNILKAATRASRAYTPKSYSGKITLFRATDLGGGIEHDPKMGWGRLAGGELETHLIPGYHAHLVLEPRVRLLGKELSRCLTQAQQAKGGKETQEQGHCEDRRTLESAKFVVSEIDTERYNN